MNESILRDKVAAELSPLSDHHQQPDVHYIQVFEKVDFP